MNGIYMQTQICTLLLFAYGGVLVVTNICILQVTVPLRCKWSVFLLYYIYIFILFVTLLLIRSAASSGPVRIYPDCLVVDRINKDVIYFVVILYVH